MSAALLKISALLTTPVSRLTSLTGTLVLFGFTRAWWQVPSGEPAEGDRVIPAVGRAPLSP
jgi:hypothetical protein